MDECPWCHGNGYIIKKVPKSLFYSADGHEYKGGWQFERKICDTCKGVGFIRHYKIRELFMGYGGKDPKMKPLVRSGGVKS